MSAKTTRKSSGVEVFLIYGALGVVRALSDPIRLRAVFAGRPTTSATEWAVGAVCGFCGGMVGVTLAALVIRRRKPWKPYRLVEIACQHWGVIIGWVLGAGLLDVIVTGLLWRYGWLRGFTFVELLVVVVPLALLAVMYYCYCRQRV